MEAYENYKFRERASQLISESNMTQTELKDALGISAGSISDLKNKKSPPPNAETLYKLAKHFNVSADWLLGLSDVQSTDQATKELCQTLGLSDVSIDYLQNSDNQGVRNVINLLFEQHDRAVYNSNHQKAWQLFARLPSKEKYSMLEELAKFCELCSADEDVEISYSNGEVTLVKYAADEMPYDTLNVDLPEFVSGVSLVELEKSRCIDKIQAVLKDYSSDAMICFYDKIKHHFESKENPNEKS